jgi:oligopeptidase B
LFLSVLCSCAARQQAQAPSPAQADQQGAATNLSSIDPLLALEMLHSEDLYAQAYFDQHDGLTRRLLAEMEDEIPESEEEIPSRLGAWEYFSKRDPGDISPVIWRRSSGTSAAPQLVLDPNQLSQTPGGTLDKMRISPDGQKVLFTLRSSSPASPALYARNLLNGEVSAALAGKVSEMEWTADSQGILFTGFEAERPARLYRLPLISGTPQLLLEEKDQAGYLWLSRSRDAQYIFLEAANALDNRIYVLRTTDSSGLPELLIKQERGVMLRAEHHAGGFYLLRRSAEHGTSLSRRETACRLPCTETGLTSDNADGSLEEMEVFESFLAVYRQLAGRRSLEFYDHSGTKLAAIKPELPAYSLSRALNPDYYSRRFRYHLSSYNLAPRIVEYNLDSGTEQAFENSSGAARHAGKYTSSRIEIAASDGTLIPVSLVWRKDREVRPAPLLLTAYGAYGAVKEDAFSPEILPLLDRGFIYATAHVRGGGENGPAWHAGGRLLNKRNSFSDFADCARKLIADKLTTPAQLFAHGQSAGGLIMGVMANEHPELFRGIVMEAPFLDPLGSALDPSLPHTPREYAEWGQPSDPEIFAGIAAYSPLQNVSARPYPAMLLMVSLNDELVSPLQALSWTRRTRAHSKSTNPILLSLDKAGSHSTRATRHDHLYFKALQQTFMLSMLR